MLVKKYFKTKNEWEVSFELPAEQAKQVALVADFNNWAPVDMTKRKKDGVFTARTRLPENGRYQFRYLVDGQNWFNDPAADAYAPNEFGDQNGVVIIPSQN